MRAKLYLTAAIILLGATKGLTQDATTEEKTARSPNIIFIMADDLGYGDLGCYGQKTIKTPNLDRLAAEGMRFTQFYAGSTVCAPSRCVLMTGKHTGHCFIRGNGKDNLRPEDVTIAEVLKSAGYECGLVGKWGLGHEWSSGIPTRQGFDYFFGYLDQHHAHNYYPTFLVKNERRVKLGNVVPNEGEYGQGKASKKIDYTHDLMAEEALQFVDRNKDKPFFLYLSLTIPHANNEARQEGMEVPDFGQYKDKQWPTPQKGHAAMISRMDADIGRLMERLRQHGIDDNTIVFFTSDNGPHREGGNDPDFQNSNGPLRGIKRSLHDGGIRVPLIVRWPGKIAPGTTSDWQGAFWDVLPTLGDLGTSTDIPAGIDGISFAPTLLGKGEQAEHDYLFWAFYEGGGARAIRVGDWKAVQQPIHDPVRLFNLADDLGERHNVANHHPELVKTFAKLMDGAYDPSPSWKFPAPRKPKPKKKPPQPNLLVILCDDLGYGDLACYGHPTIKTPNLDAMASAGLRLTSCYSSAPVCSSSRAGLLTGRAPSRVGVYDWIPGGHRMHLRAEEVSVASLLRDAGYQTCHVGKWHLNGKFNSNEQPQPDDHGFEYWYATQNNAAPSHKNPRNFVRNGDQVGQQEGFSCQLVADEAIKWLEERDESKPFFQFVCFHEPHEPVASPEELIKQYPDAKKKGEADYYANVTNMDAAVGRIMNALKEMKIDRKTMVLFTSDNGPETLKRYQRAWKSHGSPGPLRGMKLHLYEAGIRIPGILHWPGKIKSGVVSDEAISGVDILPTFCELANTEPPQDRVLDGTSFASLLSGSPVQRDKPLYWHYHRAIGEPKAAMRYGDWMLLGKWDGPQLPGGASLRAGDMALIKDAQLVDFELYNLASDLSQQHDLAASQPERVERLSRIMVDRYQEVQREGPAWEEPAKKAD